MKYLKLKKYDFLQAISDTIVAAPSMTDFLRQLPGIIRKYLPLKSTVVFYRGQTGNHFQSYPEVLENSPVQPLDEQSDIIRSFVNHKRAILLDSDENMYYDIFNKNSDRLLDRFDLNLIIPLHCRRYYRGMVLGRLDNKKKNFLKEVEEMVQAAANIFIPIIETERLELENDRNYYRLFKFDRLVLLGEMVASIVHELKTPMGTVLLEIQELNDRLAKLGHTQLTPSCKKIKEEVRRVDRFIRSLLSFSKFKEIEMQHLTLDEFVREALEEIPGKRIPPGLRLSTHLESCQIIPIDRNRTRQVFFNLLFNAFDAAGIDGNVTIGTYSERKETQKDIRYIISIRDNGPGIADEIKERIMEPFFTTKEEGTGLGLYISYGIMQSVKGDLEIESNSDGTTVYIILPGD